jgi:hypothetical protein
MQLKELRIRRRESWEPAAGQLVGEVIFSNPTSETKLALDETLSGQILHMCAGAITHSAQQVASLLIADIKQQLPALPHDTETQETTNF